MRASRNSVKTKSGRCCRQRGSDGSRLRSREAECLPGHVSGTGRFGDVPHRRREETFLASRRTRRSPSKSMITPRPKAGAPSSREVDGGKCRDRRSAHSARSDPVQAHGCSPLRGREPRVNGRYTDGEDRAGDGQEESADDEGEMRGLSEEPQKKYGEGLSGPDCGRHDPTAEPIGQRSHRYPAQRADEHGNRNEKCLLIALQREQILVWGPSGLRRAQAQKFSA